MRKEGKPFATPKRARRAFIRQVSFSFAPVNSTWTSLYVRRIRYEDIAESFDVIVISFSLFYHIILYFIVSSNESSVDSDRKWNTNYLPRKLFTSVSWLSSNKWSYCIAIILLYRNILLVCVSFITHAYFSPVSKCSIVRLLPFTYQFPSKRK